MKYSERSLLVGRKYLNPPVVEAVCEVRFSTEDSKWDPTVPGLVYEKVKERFRLSERSFVQEVTLSPDKPDAPPQASKNEVVVFRTEDKETSIKLWLETPRISITRAKPYESWNDFKPTIQYVLGKIGETVRIKDLLGIRLRYLNFIEIPQTTVIKGGDYFEFTPSIGKRLPANSIDFIVGCVFPFMDMRDLCKLQLNNTHPSKENTAAFFLDIDYMLLKRDGVTYNNVLEWIEDAHMKIEEIFEGCITDKLREIFQEVK